MNHFLHQNSPNVTHPSQIAVIGDRMLTDVMLGSLMGSWTIWLRQGVIPVNDSVLL
jgi:phosphatidylglycerophosphatase GEP4